MDEQHSGRSLSWLDRIYSQRLENFFRIHFESLVSNFFLWKSFISLGLNKVYRRFIVNGNFAELIRSSNSIGWFFLFHNRKWPPKGVATIKKEYIKISIIWTYFCCLDIFFLRKKNTFKVDFKNKLK